LSTVFSITVAHTSSDELTLELRPRRILFGLNPLMVSLCLDAGQFDRDIVDDPMLQELAASLSATQTAGAPAREPLPLALTIGSLKVEVSMETACMSTYALLERQQVSVQRVISVGK
jgi:hypothetical protein